MPEEHQLSSHELCDLLLSTASPTVWAETHAALAAIARRHGLITASADNADSVKLATCRLCDRNIFLDGGRWVHGEPSDLLSSGIDHVAEPTPDPAPESDEDAREAASALVSDAHERNTLARTIWEGNGPPDLQERFRALSNKAAEFLAYLAYSNADGNDWRAEAGLPPVTDVAEPTPDPALVELFNRPTRLDPDPKVEALRKLLADWFNGELGRISEHGSSRDWPAAIEDAKARHETFGIPWSNSFVPDYVREILAMDVEES